MLHLPLQATEACGVCGLNFRWLPGVHRHVLHLDDALLGTCSAVIQPQQPTAQYRWTSHRTLKQASHHWRSTKHSATG